MDIVINGVSYPLRFGMKFLREVDKRITVPVPNMPGVTEDAGLRYMIADIMDGSVEQLASAIFTASKAENPTLTMPAIEAFLEDENTDIDQVFEDILNFFATANVTKKTYRNMVEAMEKAKAENQ